MESFNHSCWRPSVYNPDAAYGLDYSRESRSSNLSWRSDEGDWRNHTRRCLYCASSFHRVTQCQERRRHLTQYLASPSPPRRDSRHDRRLRHLQQRVEALETTVRRQAMQQREEVKPIPSPTKGEAEKLKKQRLLLAEAIHVREEQEQVAEVAKQLLKHNDQLEAANSRLADRCDNLQKALDDAHREKEAAELCLASLDVAVEGREEVVQTSSSTQTDDELQERPMELETSTTSIIDRCNALQKALDDCTPKAEEAERNHQKTLASQKAVQAEKNQKCRALEQKLADTYEKLCEEIEELQEENEQQRLEIADLRERNQELEDLFTEVDGTPPDDLPRKLLRAEEDCRQWKEKAACLLREAVKFKQQASRLSYQTDTKKRTNDGASIAVPSVTLAG